MRIFGHVVCEILCGTITVPNALKGRIALRGRTVRRIVGYHATIVPLQINP